MPVALDPVRPIKIDEIREARKRIAGTIVRTPLVRLELGPNFPDIRLKLENLQPINAYKLRGAANAVAMLSDEERERGVWTISAGNAGQGVAYAAETSGCSLRGGRDRDRAESETRAHAFVRRKALSRFRMSEHGRLWTSARFPASTELLSIPLTIIISSQDTERWRSRFSRMRRTRSQ